MRTHPLKRRKDQSRLRSGAPPSTTPSAAAGGSGCRPGLTALGLVALVGGLLLVALWHAARSQPPHTYLLLGMDQRPEEEGPTRADVIVLAHVQPSEGRAALVSVPRDLWLPQPGGVTNRINTAAVYGYSAVDPDAGPRYLAQTLTANFRVPIAGYFLLNFDGFVRIVDAAGGVRVDVPAPIVDDAYPTVDYGVQTIRFDAGEQQLQGEQALIYVRTRHQDSDFGRAVRQQQVIQALAHKMLLPQNWWRIPGVLLAVLDSVRTDVEMRDVPALLALSLALATGESERLVLNQEYVTPWISENGAHVLLPRWETIDPAVQKVLSVETFP